MSGIIAGTVAGFLHGYWATGDLRMACGHALIGLVAALITLWLIEAFRG